MQLTGNQLWSGSSYQALNGIKNKATLLKQQLAGYEGLAKTLHPISFQNCQFHIQMTIQTKLTKKPKSLAKSFVILAVMILSINFPNSKKIIKTT